MSVVRGVMLLAVLVPGFAIGGCTVTSAPSGDGGASGSSSGGTVTTCHADSTVSCTQGSSGWSCTGHDSPEQSQALVCSVGTPDGSKTDYCCTPYDH